MTLPEAQSAIDTETWQTAIGPAAWNVDETVKEKFIEACKLAATDDAAFVELRRSDGVMAAVDNVMLCHAHAYWGIIKSQGDAVLDHMEELSYLDSVLSPPDRQLFDNWLLSPTMVRYIFRTLILDKLFGLNDKRIVEIGGGWGGLCAVINQLFKPAGYVICDLPVVQGAARRFLSHVGIGGVCFPNTAADLEGDVLVSDYAFCELNDVAKATYASSFSRFACGSLLCPPFHEERMLFTPAQFKRQLAIWTGGAAVVWGREDPIYDVLSRDYACPFVDDVYVWRRA